MPPTLSRSRAFVATFAVVVVGLAVTLLLVGRRNVERTHESGLPIDCRAAYGWLERERPEPDTTLAVTLPERLAGSAADGKVWVLERPEGRCILMKKQEEGEDFAGDLCCEAAVPPDSHPAGADGRPVISLGPGVFEELYVRQVRNPHWIEVEVALSAAGGESD